MKIVRLAIFLTGITGLALGGIMTLSSLRSAQEEAVLRSNDSLKSQATQYVDQFFGMLEATKNLNTNGGAVPSYVIDRAVVKLSKGSPTEFESFNGTDASVPINSAQTDFGLQERVLSSLKTEMSFSDLQIARISMGTFPLTDVGNKEGIYIGTPVYKTLNGVVDPNTIEKMDLTLIDPVKAFGGLAKISSAPDVSAYLISKHGKVLAHSISAFVGTDLKRIDTLKNHLENLFVGAQTGAVAKYTNVEGVAEQVAFVRAGTSPFAFAVEERAKPSVLSSAWISDQVDSGAARRNFGLLFVVVALALAAFSAISVFASKHIAREIAAGADARGKAKSAERANDRASLEHTLPIATARPFTPSPSFAAKMIPKFTPKLARPATFPPTNLLEGLEEAEAEAEDDTPISVPDSIVKSASELSEARGQALLEKEQQTAAVQGLTVNRDFARDFVDRIEKCYTLEGVEKELVQVSSEISESPVLYFRYHRRNQSLTLSSVAGDVKIQNYSNMQAYVRKDIELQVEQMADDGKVASISNYGPMSKLIISHLNVAQFEAWAVTSHAEVSPQAKLVGVVVVLQAGIRSAQARPLLAKILKDAGNYLYAQSNKIRPRSSLYNQTTNFEDNRFN